MLMDGERLDRSSSCSKPREEKNPHYNRKHLQLIEQSQHPLNSSYAVWFSDRILEAIGTYRCTHGQMPCPALLEQKLACLVDKITFILSVLATISRIPLASRRISSSFWRSSVSSDSTLRRIVASSRFSSVEPLVPADASVDGVARPASSSTIRLLTRWFSSLYACNWRFHSSTLAVDSCRAFVSRALLFLSVASSTSHFFALAELHYLNKNKNNYLWGLKYVVL